MIPLALSSLQQQIKTRCTIFTLQYVFLSTLLIIDYIIIQSPGWIIKSLMGIAILVSLFIPYIRRFTHPALPIFAWLITFYACQFIPTDYRPSHIFVNVLPALERILYGASLSEIISKHTHPILDIMAWFPYGVMHYTFPFILTFIIFTFGPPHSANIFGQAFGYMNIAGVLTQLLFPNASPWYEMSYGSAPADYSIHGEPGGLARIDNILGLELYGSTFGGSPLVFGAFPSLHSASATIEMLFITYLYPELWPFGVAYTMWLWWSTMYLTHHYLIDLVGGSIYAFLAFFAARQFLPQVDPAKRNRLAYFAGIPTTPHHNSLSNFLHSIEYSRCFGKDSMKKGGNDISTLEASFGGDTVGTDEEEWVALSTGGVQYNFIHDSSSMGGDDDGGESQGIYVLTEPGIDKQQEQLQHPQPQKQYYHHHRHQSIGNGMKRTSEYIRHENRTPPPDDEINSTHTMSDHTSTSELNSQRAPSPDQYATGWEP